MLAVRVGQEGIRPPPPADRLGLRQEGGRPGADLLVGRLRPRGQGRDGRRPHVDQLLARRLADRKPGVAQLPDQVGRRLVLGGALGPGLRAGDGGERKKEQDQGRAHGPASGGSGPVYRLSPAARCNNSGSPVRPSPGKNRITDLRFVTIRNTWGVGASAPSPWDRAGCRKMPQFVAPGKDVTRTGVDSGPGRMSQNVPECPTRKRCYPPAAVGPTGRPASGVYAWF